MVNQEIKRIIDWTVDDSPKLTAALSVLSRYLPGVCLPEDVVIPKTKSFCLTHLLLISSLGPHLVCAYTVFTCFLFKSAFDKV